jgi:hypothetical protein
LSISFSANIVKTGLDLNAYLYKHISANLFGHYCLTLVWWGGNIIV